MVKLYFVYIFLLVWSYSEGREMYKRFGGNMLCKVMNKWNYILYFWEFIMN